MKRTFLILILGIGLLFSQDGLGQTPLSARPDRRGAPQFKDLQLDRRAPRKQPTLEEDCPKSPRLARLRAMKDVAKFARTHSLATRSTFLQTFKRVYGECPQFVKRAYQEAAQAILVPRPPERFKR